MLQQRTVTLKSDTHYIDIDTYKEEFHTKVRVNYGESMLCMLTLYKDMLKPNYFNTEFLNLKSAIFYNLSQ